MTPIDGPRRIGDDLSDEAIFADMARKPVAAQVIPDDAAKVKSGYILRSLINAGLKTPYGFDVDDAIALWAARLGQYSINVLEAAAQEWITKPGNEWPSLGDIETVAKQLQRERDAMSPEEMARTARVCRTCEGLHVVRVAGKTTTIPVGKDMVPTEVPVSVMRPCPDCPEMAAKSELWDRGHFDAEHQDAGGCPKCWPYMPSQAHRAKAQAKADAAR